MPRPSKPQPPVQTGPRLVRKNSLKTPVTSDVTHEQIAGRAYELFTLEGYAHGNHVDHWLRAERELKGAPPVEQPKRVTATRARR
jgi:hypothetical protein